MSTRQFSRRLFVGGGLATLGVLAAACGGAAASPAAAPTKPAAEPTKPAAEPTKPAAAATKPVAAATPASAAKEAAAKVKIMVGGLNKQIYLPNKLTESLGYFKDENLDVSLIDEPS